MSTPQEPTTIGPDVTTLTQQEAHQYLQDLRQAILNPGTDYDMWGKGFEADRQAYHDKIDELKNYLATFPVPLNLGDAMAPQTETQNPAVKLDEEFRTFINTNGSHAYVRAFQLTKQNLAAAQFVWKVTEADLGRFIVIPENHSPFIMYAMDFHRQYVDVNIGG